MYAYSISYCLITISLDTVAPSNSNHGEVNNRSGNWVSTQIKAMFRLRNAEAILIWNSTPLFKYLVGEDAARKWQERYDLNLKDKYFQLIN